MTAFSGFHPGLCSYPPYGRGAAAALRNNRRSLGFARDDRASLLRCIQGPEGPRSLRISRMDAFPGFHPGLLSSAPYGRACGE